MTPNSCNLKCVESIESSPALSLHHNVSPKRLQGIFFPHGEKIKEREEEKRERKGGKNLLTLAGGGGWSAIKVLFRDTFSLLYGVLHPSLAVAKI